MWDGCAVPTIKPPHLVVEYRGPASAICTTNQSVDNMNWEANAGVSRKIDEQSMVWSVSSIPWAVGNGVQCYTETDIQQCVQHLPITIYKIPDSVILSRNESGPLKENREYTLRCEVESVAPVENLHIIWYRGDTVMATSTNQSLFSTVAMGFGPDDKSQDVTASLTITASRKHPNATYSCAARLNLNATVESSCNNETCTYTTEAIDDTKSNDMQLKVWYKPRMLNVTGNVTAKAGDKLMLACRANANPTPSYQWKHNGAALANQKSNTLQLDAIGEANGGVYECTATNTQGEGSARITVTVETQESGTTLPSIVQQMELLCPLLPTSFARPEGHSRNQAQ
ncbi:hemicentin-2-like [Engraulis encrasicolus]|uniref:hemicentin-2-like n=1 Tax=Engraulis encrasicolus TaxID=184585 RepID=UPI002FD6A5B7